MLRRFYDRLWHSVWPESKADRITPDSVFLYFIFHRNGMVRKRSQMQLANSNSLGDFMTLKKASSCSTIYIDDSTVSQPNLKNTIKCVSLAIYYHIKNRKSDTILDIFDEKKQPLTVSFCSPLFLSICLYFFPGTGNFFYYFDLSSLNPYFSEQK